jgi:hypothetical protein
MSELISTTEAREEGFYWVVPEPAGDCLLEAR